MSDIERLKEVTIKELYSILVSGNHPVSLSQLEYDYRSIVGRPIPLFKMGYSNLELLLRDYPSLFHLHWKGSQLKVAHVPTTGVQYIESLIQNQKPKKIKPGKPRRDANTIRRCSNSPQPVVPTVPSIIRGQIRGLLLDYRNGILVSNFNSVYSKRFGMMIDFSKLGFGSLLEMLQSIPDIVNIVQDDGGMYKAYPVVTRQQLPQKGNHSSLPLRFQQSKHLSKSSDKSFAEVAGTADTFEDQLDSSGVDAETQRCIQELLASHKDGLWLTQFQNEYRTRFNEELDVQKLGYTSIISLMCDLPHIVTIQRANQKDWLLFDARSKKQSEVKQNVSDNYTHIITESHSVSTEVKNSIRQVLSHYKQGLVLNELIPAYQMITGETLDPEQLGFADLHEFVAALHDIIEVDSRPGVTLLYPLPQSKNLEPSKIPHDVIGPGASYTPQIISRSELTQKANYIEVYVATVKDPDHLWIQLKGSETSDKLDELMDSIQMTYSSNRPVDYSLPAELIQPQQVCAAVYPPEGTWHRCQITKVINAAFVELFYVDYGSTYTVTKNSLKFLRWCHFQLPAQAIPARLSNLKPKHDVWTEEAKHFILSLVMDKPLYALVTDISSSGKLTICLTDTTGETDIHITDELIDKGLAELDVAQANKDSTLPSSVAAEGDSLSLVTCKDELVKFQRFVKPVQLTPEYSVHIICYKGVPYVTTADTSKLLWPEQDDILRIRLKQLRIQLKITLLVRDENPLLFYELTKYPVAGVCDDVNKPKDHVAVIELGGILNILKIFNHPSKELANAIVKEIQMFDSSDPCWMQEMTSQTEREMKEYLTQRLNTALESLNYKRMSIIQMMRDLNCTTISDILVQSQKKVEKNIQMFSQCLEELSQL